MILKPNDIPTHWVRERLVRASGGRANAKELRVIIDYCPASDAIKIRAIQGMGKACLFGIALIDEIDVRACAAHQVYALLEEEIATLARAMWPTPPPTFRIATRGPRRLESRKAA